MPQFTLKERTLPCVDTYDVIVAGGGPAGCTAAAAAAREGARTLLIEATGALGGMGTSGLVPAWCPFTDKEKIIYRGMAEKVLRDCMAGMPHVPKDRYDWTPIDPERLKGIYDDLVTGHGADVLFNTFITAVETDDAKRITALIAAHKGGLTAYTAKVFVDATGDADLAAWAGAAYEQGDPDDGDLQPATLCFILGNVDMYAYAWCGNPRPAMERILAEGHHPLIPDSHACNNIVGPGAIGFNAGHLWEVDNTDPVSVSKGLIEGRKIASAFRDAMAEYLPKAFANAWLAQTAPLLGIRETRRIIGDYILTEDDFKSLRSFDDEIARNCYFIDVHHKKSEVALFNHGAKHGNDGALKELKIGRYDLNPGESHGIPYRCLTPKGLPNVLVAGRSISTDRVTQGSTRVMPVCLVMGEAAGTAAAMAAATPAPDVHTVDTDKLRARLREMGAWLP